MIGWTSGSCSRRCGAPAIWAVTMRCAAMLGAGRRPGEEDGGEALRGLHSAELRAGRGVPVRLVGGMDLSSTASPSRRRWAQVRLCHSRMPYIRAYPRQSQEMVFDAHARAFAFWGGGLRARHLRQHEDRGRRGVRRQGAQVQPPLRPDVLALPGRADRLHARGRVGEGPGREPGRQPAPAPVRRPARGSRRWTS